MLGLSMDYTPIHGDDEAFLVFTDSFEDITGVSDEELDTSKKMIKYWTNFAKYGNPNSQTAEDEELPIWYPYNQDEKVNHFNSLFDLSLITIELFGTES